MVLHSLLAEQLGTKKSKAISNKFSLLESVINSSIDGILAFDTECRYIIWNAAMERISGKAREECIGKVAFDVFPFLKASGEDASFYRTLQGEVVKATDRPYQVPETGREGFFEAIYTPILDDEGNVIGGLGVIHDITERKIYERVLRESELKHRSVTQFANDAIIACNSQGTILSWNLGAETIFDYSESEILGKNISLLIPEYVWSNYLQEVRADSDRDYLIKRGRASEIYGFRKHGSSFPMDITLSTWRRGEEIYLSAIVRDVTDRKHMEAQVEERQHLYHALMRAQSDLGEGVVIIDAETEKYIYVNEAFCRLTGYSEEELLQMHNIMALIPQDQLQLNMRRQAFRRQKNIESSQFEMECIRKDGTRIQIEVAGKTIETSHGQSLIGLVRDITERKAIVQTLKETAMRNHKLMELARDIIVNISADGSIALLSPAFKAITGWSTSEWLGKKFENLLHADDLVAYFADFHRVLEGKTSACVQMRWMNSQNIYQEIEVSMTPMFANGRVVGSTTIIRDISERIKQEQSILEEQKRYQALAEASGRGVCITEQGSIIEANTEFAKLFGYEETEILGMNPIKFTVPEDQELVRNYITSGYDFPYHITGLRKDGTTFRVEIRGKNFSYKGKNVRVAILSKSP